MADFQSIEMALNVREQMFTLHDKRLYIILYGDLISTSYKEKLENDLDKIDNLFDDLVSELEKAVSII